MNADEARMNAEKPQKGFVHIGAPLEPRMDRNLALSAFICVSSAFICD